MQIQTKQSPIQTENSANLSHVVMDNMHARGTVPAQKVITQEQMRKIHSLGGYVPAGWTVI